MPMVMAPTTDAPIFWGLDTMVMWLVTSPAEVVSDMLQSKDKPKSV